MIRGSFLLLLAASAASAQTNVRFPDGTVIEIQTKSTGAAAPVSTSGSEFVAEGYDYHRLVVGKDQVLLGYDIEARATPQGAFALRIKPVNREQIAIGGRGKWLDIPTVTGVREFPPLGVGDAVEVDILSNPATRERIFDVLKVLPPRQPSRRAPQPAGDRFSFESVAIAIDGKSIGGSQNSWMRGGAMMIHLPDRGRFYLALAPLPDYSFQPAGWIDHNVLRFHAGAELVQITSRSNMLQKAEFGTVWVYSVPDVATGGASPDRLRQDLAEKRRVYGPSHPEILALEKRLQAMDPSLDFHCADTIDQLLPPK